MPWTHADWITLGADLIAIIAAIVTVAAIIRAPVIALQISEKLQRRSDAQKTKLTLFATLTALRHDPLSAEAIRSLNLIDVVFVDDRDVREAWSAYHASITDPNLNNPVGYSVQNEKRRDLLVTMVKAMGLGDKISSTDLMRTYTPKAAMVENVIVWAERELKLRRLRDEIAKAKVPYLLQAIDEMIANKPAVSEAGAAAPALTAPTTQTAPVHDVQKIIDGAPR